MKKYHFEKNYAGISSNTLPSSFMIFDGTLLLKAQFFLFFGKLHCHEIEIINFKGIKKLWMKMSKKNLSPKTE